MRALWVSGALTLLMWAQGALAGTVLVVGDSISAALGVDTRQGWVALLQKRLQDGGFEHRVVNASISGDTSSGGAARLPALLAQHQPELVIIELGGNDGLRGQPLVQLQQNLARMIDASRAAEADVPARRRLLQNNSALPLPFPYQNKTLTYCQEKFHM